MRLDSEKYERELALSRLFGVFGRWKDALHPRGPGGKFADVPDSQEVGAKGSSNGSVPSPEANPGSDGPDDGEWHDVGDDIHKAAELLAEGKKVRLDQPEQVSTLLDKLAEMVRDAEEKGEDAPTYDLCKVTVKDTNLFCAESKGIPRVQMPQLKGVPTKGSKAAQFVEGDKGEADLSKQFADHLRAQGITIEDAEPLASHLRASQNELNGAKVAGMVGYMKDGGEIKGEPLFVSRDNYIVDGHHRWAATVGFDSLDGDVTDFTMPVRKIDLDIGTLLDMANQFAEEWGIPQAAVGQSAQQAAGLKAALSYMDDDCGCDSPDPAKLELGILGRIIDFDPSLHPRDPYGKFKKVLDSAKDHDQIHVYTPEGKQDITVNKFGGKFRVVDPNRKGYSNKVRDLRSSAGVTRRVLDGMVDAAPPKTKKEKRAAAKRDAGIPQGDNPQFIKQVTVDGIPAQRYEGGGETTDYGPRLEQIANGDYVQNIKAPDGTPGYNVAHRYYGARSNDPNAVRWHVEQGFGPALTKADADAIWAKRVEITDWVKSIDTEPANFLFPASTSGIERRLRAKVLEDGSVEVSTYDDGGKHKKVFGASSLLSLSQPVNPAHVGL